MLAVLTLPAQLQARAVEDIPYNPAPPAEVAKKIDEAREAWRRGDKLGQQARENMLDVKGSQDANLKLLNGQTKAYEEAEAAFSEALKLDRKHATALETYARYMLARGRRGMAALLFEQALMSPRAKDTYQPEERADILRTLAGLLERGGQGERAVNLYRHAMELDPRDARNRISLAVCQCSQGEPEFARETLQPWLDGKVSSARLTPALKALGQYTLAYTLEQGGQPEDALATYKLARETSEQAGTADDIGVAEQAKLAARRVRGVLRDLNPDASKLAQARLEALAREFKNRDKPLAQKFDELKERAPAEFAATVLEVTALAKDLKNKDPFVTERLSALVSELNGAAEARQRFAKANMQCNQGVQLKMELLQDRKALDEAVQKYVKAHPGAEEELARTDPVVKKLLATIQHFQDALQSWSKLARAHLELGWCKMALGDMEAAEAHFDAAALYDPLAPYVLIRQAEVRFMLEDWDGSSEAFAKLARVDPEYGPAYLGMARVACKTGTTYTALDIALDNLDRAERMGVQASAVEGVRKTLGGLVARLDRGEKLKAMPGRKRTESAAAPSENDSSKDFRDIFENTFGP